MIVTLSRCLVRERVGGMAKCDVRLLREKGGLAQGEIRTQQAPKKKTMRVDGVGKREVVGDPNFRRFASVLSHQGRQYLNLLNRWFLATTIPANRSFFVLF